VSALLARDAVELVGSAERAKVKESTNADCTRLFHDVSRGSSRRWCGMAECGNRIKAADYRKRQRGRLAATPATHGEQVQGPRDPRSGPADRRQVLPVGGECLGPVGVLDGLGEVGHERLPLVIRALLAHLCEHGHGVGGG